jgi:large subunit ribosomal protein L9
VRIRQAGDTGQLYGSVSTRDIADVVTEGGFSVERRQILLDRPIKALGLHDVQVALHPEVVVKVKINVARSHDEAERQARGEDVTMIREEAPQLETFDPDAVFEPGAAPEAEQPEDEGEGKGA